LYFLGYEDVASAPADHIKRTEWTFRQKATLELTQCVLVPYTFVDMFFIFLNSLNAHQQVC